MPTNLAIDDALLGEALSLGGLKTKKDTVNAALREFVQRRQRRAALRVLGTVDFDATYDYKAGRRKR